MATSATESPDENREVVGMSCSECGGLVPDADLALLVLQASPTLEHRA
jgi:hypothetical protein